MDDDENRTIYEEVNDNELEFDDELPLLPIRNHVLFPGSVAPFDVGREKSVALVEDLEGETQPVIVIFAQKDPATDDPAFDDLYPVGVAARVLKALRHSTGNYSLILQGLVRVRLEKLTMESPYMKGHISRLDEPKQDDVECEALAMSLRDTAKQVIQLMPELPREAGSLIDSINEPGQLADLVSANLEAPPDEKAVLLEAIDVKDRIRKVLRLLTRQLEVLKMRERINSQIKEEMGKNQREYVLRQQLKAIKEELGEEDGDQSDLDLLDERLAKASLSKEAESVCRKQLKRLRSMQVGSAEYTVVRTYIDWILDLPWEKATTDMTDIAEVRRVLDEDHSGLEKIKKRIVEYLAVRKLKPDKKGPILCLIGPPGVGKTSLGRSVARALGRKFVRISLGGVHDEAAIRGHRRTYVGALPGRLITGLKKAQSNNPVFVLDEIDKMAADFSGDPASALLEALDPEQNNAFVDHYLGVPADLSNVLFVATANRKDTIPNALLDRMEVIDIPGYTREDKIAIARQFLVPRQLSDHGLTPEHLEITDEAIERLVTEYTHEAGVRQLSKEVAAICRDVAVRVANGDDAHVDADGKFVEKVLGAPKREVQVAEKLVRPGIATTLTWTPSGGEILLVESTAMQGRGAVHTTGSMGDILKESVAAAFTYIRVRAARFGLAEDFLEKLDVHVHLPKGAMPKDGPAMGLSILVSLLSLFKEVRVRPDVALTGEITLRGKVLKVEGLKPKCLAAHHAGMKHVVIPRANAPELEEIPEKIRHELKLHLVSSVDEALELAFEKPLVSPARPAAPAPPPV